MNYYQTLQIDSQATAREIKQAYRKLAKVYHPDTKATGISEEEIVRINAAYEVLSNPSSRRRYDRQLQAGNSYEDEFLSNRQTRTAKASQAYKRRRQDTNKTEISYQKWLQVVYAPCDRYIREIIAPLEIEIENLSADPFDDELIEDFQAYLETCRHYLQLAQQRFAAYPNPAQLARVAANLYYCLDRVEDGIKELEYFPLNYDEYYIHTGQEILRIADGLRCEAEDDIRAYS